jgi:hypothetical protein
MVIRAEVAGAVCAGAPAADASACASTRAAAHVTIVSVLLQGLTLGSLALYRTVVCVISTTMMSSSDFWEEGLAISCPAWWIMTPSYIAAEGSARVVESS